MVEKGKPVTLIDMERIWLSHLEKSSSLRSESLLLEDGIHLSEEGHLIYTDYLIPKVIEKLIGMNGAKPDSCCS